ENVQPSVFENRSPRELSDRFLVGDVDANCECSSDAACGHDFGGDILGARLVQVSDHDVSAPSGEQTGARASDSACAAGDDSYAAGEFAPRRGLGELVPLERPVLDGERLALAQRSEATQRVGGILDGDRAVVKIARHPRTSRVRPGGDNADAWDQGDPRTGGIHRELPGLVVEIALVVVPIPGRECADSIAEARFEDGGVVLLWIELD